MVINVYRVLLTINEKGDQVDSSLISSFGIKAVLDEIRSLCHR
jgi:hypothetical protein